jgi:hypothetical protein
MVASVEALVFVMIVAEVLFADSAACTSNLLLLATLPLLAAGVCLE